MFYEFMLNDSENLKDFIPISIGQEDCSPNHKFGPFVREYYLIHFVLEGAGTLKDKYGTHAIKKGKVFIIRPDEATVYQADSKSPWKYSWIYFSGGLSSTFNTERSVYDCPVEILEKIGQLTTEKCTCSLAYSAILNELAYKLFRYSHQEDLSVVRIKNYLEFNYMKDIKVLSIAKEFGFDRTYLFKMFKKEYGYGIKEYLLKVRMERAMIFLKKGYNVSTTALMVGYKDEFNFSKCFKKRFGISPKEYKKSR